MKLEKIAIVLSGIALFCSLTLLISQQQIPLVTEIQNPKIFCHSREYGSSNWYRGENNPSFGSGEDIQVGVSVTNNVSLTLFNLQVVVSYKTTSNTWNTTSKNIGILDIEQNKQTQVSLTNPELETWTFNTTISYNPKRYGIVTRYVLNATNYKITAYGFARP